MGKYGLFVSLIIFTIGGILLWRAESGNGEIFSPAVDINSETVFESTTENQGGLIVQDHPLEIEYLSQQEYPGSQLEIEQTLNPGSNYQRYIVSYRSEGLKQYALLTIPNGDPPESGWPAIIFNHGYIPPQEYRTTERYVAYTGGFSRNGYVLLRPDYRGHGNSQGEARGGYSNSDYLIDVLNAYSSLVRRADVDPDKVGMWGHSMGGWITQRAMVIKPQIKVGVIWAGVVGGYDDLLEIWRPYWQRNNLPEPSPVSANRTRRWRTYLVEEHGSPQDNPEFWASISSTAYLDRMSGPIQLHHGTNDTSVPHQLAERFYSKLVSTKPTSQLHLYQGDDHNISNNFSVAMTRSVDFFDQYLKD